ncbi:SUR7/PalI family-domain-containing protein [Chaetomium sp. MPI-CAGE-AT-0009]|nr:SUR7/PalI family-domain-containing protein [Chaetomium sp. MPI-CAGE-AT-0009]
MARSSLNTKHAFRAIPLVCSLVAFILVMLALFAGNKPGVLEGYNIIMVDASGLGNNLGNNVKRNTLPPSPPNPEERSGGQINSDINNDIMDGAEESAPAGAFYSLFALTICEGGLTVDSGRKLSQCYAYFSSSDEVSTIPALLSTRGDSTTTNTAHSRTSNALTQAGLTYKLEAALCGLDTLLRAVGVMLAMGAGFTGLSFFASLPAMAISSKDYTISEMAYDWAVWTNLTFASGAVLFLLMGALVSAVGAADVANRINRVGAESGVTAVAGTNWVALSWAVVVLMSVVLAYWAARGASLRRGKKAGKRRTKRDEEAAPKARPPSPLPRKTNPARQTEKERPSSSPKDSEGKKPEAYVPSRSKTS